MSGAKYRVLLHRDVADEVAAVPKKLRARIRALIDGLAVNPTPQGAERLKGRKNAYRLRIAEYRILYEVHVAEVVVYVFGVGHRREVYLRLLRRT